MGVGTGSRRRVVIAVNSTWNLLNFRSGLIRALVASGYEVVAVAPPDAYVPELTVLGCRFVPLSIDHQGTHPGRDLLLLWRFYILFRHERPDIYLGYTVKPNVYGSLAAHILGIPVVNNITGLGAVFIKDSWLTHVVRVLYRLALSRSAKVFFQNNDDRQIFILGGLVTPSITDRLPGSGIDLTKFTPSPLPGRSPLRFLLIARMLWDKGVGEFVDAARILKCRGINADFCLLGFLDVQNPAAICRKQMDDWVEEGVVRYLGVSKDVRTEIELADCVVLPSYREGTPRTLLEAAAMGRPIVTTNSAGCRDVVDDGINGYLCQLKDAKDLADKMYIVASLSSEAREIMGYRSRKKVENEFDERTVINKYLEAISSILQSQESESARQPLPK